MPHQLEVTDKIYENECETPRYQNTYRLEPMNPFKIDAVDKIVKSVMTGHLENVTYDPADSPKLCENITSEIRRRIKKLNFDRYKVIVTVTIIEKASQSLITSIGYLWDSSRDNYSTFSLETRTFHACCCVFGIYHE